ncbi:zf-CCHC domain-containing protein [Tanacetum coccineum]
MSIRQVWKRKTSTLKSSPPSQNDSPPLPPRVYLQSPSPPSYNPLRDQMINQLHNISTILDSHTNPSNAYIHVLPSPPPPQIHPPSHAQVEFHSSFCHCCKSSRHQFYSLRNEINFIHYLLTRPIPPTRKDIKVKKSTNEQKNQQEMKRQVQERDMRKDIKAGSADNKRRKSMKTQLKSKDQ